MILSIQEQLLKIRTHGPEDAPVLVYLPGLHGDWTLIGNFRKALAERLRFIEVAYPETSTWSLEDHAKAIEATLQEIEVSHGWILGESFGSQIVWKLLERGHFRIEGVILAGGFVRHPTAWGAHLCAWCSQRISASLIRKLLLVYTKVAPWRFHRDIETASSIRQYMERSTEQTRQALAHRLRLVALNDPSSTVRQMDIPLFALAGFWDPIVPWFPVRSWLKRNCTALRDYRVIGRADHNVLGTASPTAAEQVLRWMASI